MANNKDNNKVIEDSTISKSLDELIELKKNENSALKKIFESLKTSEEKNTNK